MRALLLLSAIFLILSCSRQSDGPAADIVDKAIETHGGRAFDEAHFQFRFRDRDYTWYRNGGRFEYRRIFTDSTGQTVTDVLNNQGFTRLVEGRAVELPEERRNAFTNSVNSVIYFAVLPYRLNDEAVRKEYLGETEIKGEPYQKVKVTFEQEGGGEDFEDEFIYWFHSRHHTMDYMAYSYHTEGGGMRFREAYNPRNIGGIRWQDYINYKPASAEARLEELDKLFDQDELEELSRIELEDIRELEGK